ncbi:VOC family protein [Mesobacillus subterraneus]|uniref:VOC family protein n=1 Tax=Mesobacillus subterraneus TaxID=285983 RepID=UPI00203D0D8C|nr:VOC family protein [Mesobacillus subterraneus]MCM3664992.1 VOC family protein [Mesobacillus subterraneus]MCM3682079.1 VOC family protein [Mesobacillus subterraneus]
MRIHHFAMEVKDLALSKTFYENVLGFKEHSKPTFLGEKIVFLELAGFKLELTELIGNNKQTIIDREHVHLCFEVDDLREKIRRFEEMHIAPEEGPYQLNNGWETVFYQGPDNEILEFLEINIPNNIISQETKNE